MRVRAGLKALEESKITASIRKGNPWACPYLATVAEINRPSICMLEWTGGSVYSRKTKGIVQPTEEAENMWWKVKCYSRVIWN